MEAVQSRITAQPVKSLTYVHLPELRWHRNKEWCKIKLGRPRELKKATDKYHLARKFLIAMNYKLIMTINSHELQAYYDY